MFRLALQLEDDALDELLAERPIGRALKSRASEVVEFLVVGGGLDEDGQFAFMESHGEGALREWTSSLVPGFEDTMLCIAPPDPILLEDEFDSISERDESTTLRFPHESALKCRS